MSAKTLWDSNAETISYEILKKLINTDDYNISPHTSLKDIFSAEQKELWSDYHVDFLITDRKGLPVLGIEISGIEHWNNKDTINHDEIKKQLFFEHSVPLIIIPLAELSNYSKETYGDKYKDELNCMISVHLSHLFYNTSYPAYCWKCYQKLAYRYRLDHSGAFYCCINKECKNYKNSTTLSTRKIPSILNETMFSKFKKLKTPMQI